MQLSRARLSSVLGNVLSLLKVLQFLLLFYSFLSINQTQFTQMGRNYTLVSLVVSDRRDTSCHAAAKDREDNFQSRWKPTAGG